MSLGIISKKISATQCASRIKNIVSNIVFPKSQRNKEFRNISILEVNSLKEHNTMEAVHFPISQKMYGFIFQTTYHVLVL